MKTIEQTSLALLALVLIVFFLMAGMLVLREYTSQPSLFIPPPEGKEYSSVKLIKESNSLEGLKMTCLIWAKRDDETRKYLNSMNERINSSVHKLTLGALWASVLLGAGLIHINLSARRQLREHGGAL
jgi:hypothetical protein